MTRAALLAAVAAALLAAPATAHAEEPADLVDPFVGTDASAQDFGTGGGAGNTFPGAATPFGMVQFSPDTVPGDRAFGGGYSHVDRTLAGFSLRHLSGPGCSVYGDVPILPTTAPVVRSPADPLRVELGDEHLASFSHDRERARPGAYDLTLNADRGAPIDAALTATTRSAAARLRFPAGRPASVLVNAAGSLVGARDATVRIDPARREVTGSVGSGYFCFNRNRYRLYFAARFSRPFAAHGTWVRQLLRPGSTEAGDDLGTDPRVKRPIPGVPDEGNGGGPTAQTGAYLTFGAGGEEVEVRVGVSYVDVDGARRNLEREQGDRSFDALRDAAARTWREALGRARVEGGERRDRARFATALYHALLHPSTVSDADGRYRGMDDRVHVAEGWTKYGDFSGWDTYRAQMPLVAMLHPDRAADMARSLVADGEQSGWLPKWSVANGQTNVMVGDPALPIIASAHAFGGRTFDARAALAAMVRNATVPGTSPNGGYVARAGLAEYLRLGFVPYERNTTVFGQAQAPELAWGASSTTQEYAIADAALARFAAATGQRATCLTFARRSGSWRAVLDPATRLPGRRSASGAFLPGTDPESDDGFVEGSAAQYTWSVPHDPAGLIAALGGREPALRRLDAFFRQINAGPRSTQAFLGNEPTLGTPWLYAWLARPDGTQRVVRRALLELYDMTPGGFPGNDDLGAMSAWWVLGALGLYPAVPGTDVLTIGSPLFPRATVRLPGGRELVIEGRGAARGAPFVRGLRIDGAAHDRPWVRWAELAGGARLAFDLAAQPAAWGRDPEGAPPSLDSAGRVTCAPELPRARTGTAALGLPGGRRCLSRRAFTIRLRGPRGERRLRAARVTVDGRRVRVRRRGGRLVARVDLRGRRRGTVRVRAVVVTRAGRRAVATRTYRTCVPRRRS